MIYYVEDDRNIRELVLYTLGSTGFAAQGFADGDAFFAALRNTRPELVLLDLMLPGETGLDILKRLRANPHTASTPVILLTARDSEFDKVTGLDLGADDYLTKPFGMMELVSRIRAVLRRSVPAPAEAPLQAGPLALWPQSHTVTADGVVVELTLKEFQLLAALLARPNQTLTRESLLEGIWGYDAEVETRTLDVHIRSLRQKLGGCGALIETVRGVGYKLGTGKV